MTDDQKKTGMVDSALNQIDTELKKKQHVYNELQGISSLISSLKDEIKNTKVEEAAKIHVPLASDELSEVYKSIEKATNDIMNAAEKIESDEEASKMSVVQEAVTNIYEACSFQDITGQRISKIIRAIQAIDTAIKNLVGDVSDLNVVPKKVSHEKSLLNGPQNEDNAISQDEIDKLLNG